MSDDPDDALLTSLRAKAPRCPAEALAYNSSLVRPMRLRETENRHRVAYCGIPGCNIIKLRQAT